MRNVVKGGVKSMNFTRVLPAAFVRIPILCQIHSVNDVATLKKNDLT